MHGFQLWANLPSSLKMTAPRYQDVKGKDIPEIMDDDGTIVKVIVGSFWGKTGPVDGIAADPQYLDIYVPPNRRKTFKVDTYRRAFAYVFEGKGSFRDAAAPKGVLLEKELRGQEVNIRDMSGDRTLVQFGTGDEVTVTAGPDGIRVNAVAPGPFPTESAWEKLNPIPEASMGATQADAIPMRRFGRMDELRNLMTFLMADGSEFITGQTIGIDGGHHLAAPSTFADLSALTDDQWRRAAEAIRASAAKEKAQRTV